MGSLSKTKSRKSPAAPFSHASSAGADTGSGSTSTTAPAGAPPLHPLSHPTASPAMAEWVQASHTTRLRLSCGLPGRAVEAIGYGASYSVLFASEAEVQNDEPYVPTRRAKVQPSTDAEARSLMVRGSDPFEVRLAGVQAASQDRALPGARKNELVIYSVHKDPSGIAADGVPLVHYDFATARESTAAGVYFPIPASKSVVARGGVYSCGGSAAVGVPRSHLNVRLVVLEVDDVAALKTSVESVENLTGGLAALSSSLGVAGVGAIGPALRVAGALSREALDKHAKPDRVLSVDMDFRLAPPKPAAFPTYASEFLMRGYYFFLSAPCDAALYAQTNTSDNVRLVARRTRGRGWAPLTNISYIVVRVTAPYDAGAVGPVTVPASGGARVAALYEQEPTRGEGVLAALGGALGLDGGGMEGATAASGGNGGRSSIGGLGGAAAAAAVDPLNGSAFGPSLSWAGDSGGGGNVIDVILDAYERRRAVMTSPSPPPPPVQATPSGVTLTMPVPADPGTAGLRAAFEADLVAAHAAQASDGSDSGSGERRSD